jgi:tetratricopeptide (TPR) repeat protein
VSSPAARGFPGAQICALMSVLLAAGSAAAQSRDENVREAGKHFERGVALYSEADYRGALVEFKRADQLAPNPTVLYNVGQTQFQLRDYAAALTTLERYLAEAGPAAANRAEVESTLEVLRSRVGRLTPTTDPPGAEVSVDDAPVGRSPFDKPLLVSVGHLKVTAAMTGRTPATRWVDVAAGDEVSIALQLGPAPALNQASTASPFVDVASQPRAGEPRWHTAGWIITGTAAAGAVAFAFLARKESNDLQDARRTYPTTESQLSHLANLTTAFAAIADSLAAVALIAGGITLYSTLSSGGSEGGGGKKTEARLGVGPGAIRLETTF